VTRAVITGVGVVSGAGVGAAALSDALSRGEALGAIEEVEALRGRSHRVRVARIPPFDRGEHIPPRKLRRMGDVSQIWMIACLLARNDARLDDAATAPPGRRGTFAGTGYGCIDTTWDYLVGLYNDGAGVANPFLFSESVANAPAGHSAIELDTRGASVTFTCADVSAAAAVEFGARAVREGRVDLVYCGGVDLMSTPLLRALTAFGTVEFVGEGAACIILESERHARQRGARVYAELAGSGMASDPSAPAAGWGTDPGPLGAAIRRALDRARREADGPVRAFLHPCGDAAAEAAQRTAVKGLLPEAILEQPGRVTGSLAGAGGLGIAAAVLDGRQQDALVCATGWGGSIYALMLRPFTNPPGPRL